MFPIKCSRDLKREAITGSSAATGSMTGLQENMRTEGAGAELALDLIIRGRQHEGRTRHGDRDQEPVGLQRQPPPGWLQVHAIARSRLRSGGTRGRSCGTILCSAAGHCARRLAPAQHVPIVQGLGRGPFKAETRVRIPVGTPHNTATDPATSVAESRRSARPPRRR